MGDAEAPVVFIVADAPQLAVDMKERQFFGTVNTPRVDMDREVVLPSGIDRSYFPDTVRAVYLNHDYGCPIGKCRNLAGGASFIRALTRMASTQLATDVLTMIAEGVINGLSIGFTRTDSGPLTADEARVYPGATSIVRKWRCIEYSVTAMPCNPDATIDTKSMDRKMMTVERLLSAERIFAPSARAAGFSVGPKMYRLHPVRAVVLDDGDIL